MEQGQERRSEATGGFGRRVRFWLGAVGLGLMVVLILQNQDPVDTHLLFWQFTAPLFLLLSMVGGLGVLAGFLLGRFGRRRE